VNFFEEQRREAVEWANRELLMIAWAESIVNELGLQDIMPYVTKTLLWEDYTLGDKIGHPDWLDWERVPDGKYILSLYIPMADKEQVRPHLLHLEWNKHNHIITHTNLDNTPYLVESWRHKTDATWNSHIIYIDFYRPTQVGESVNSNGCKVTQVTKQYNDLVLACEVA
jgi:hypothetical protein